MNKTRRVRLSLGVAALALFAALLIPGAAQAQTFKVTLLGTGDPVARIDRFGPSILVEAGSQILQFDAGRGATQRLAQLRMQGGRVTALFLTHFHSDHVVGLPDLWLHGRRTSPMKIVGPVGTRTLLDGLTMAFQADISIRIKDENRSPEGYKFDLTEFDHDGVVYEKDGVKVTAFAVDHGEFIKPSYGYRVDYGGHSVVMSGDTRFDQNVIKAAKGVDLLIHEVAAGPSGAGPDGRGPGGRGPDGAGPRGGGPDGGGRRGGGPGGAGPRGGGPGDGTPPGNRVLAHHTSPEEAGTVFKLAAPKMAVFCHYTLMGGGQGGQEVTPDQAVERARKTYDGPLIAGEDLMSFEIGETVVMKKFGA